jgi:hypothetical protein
MLKRVFWGIFAILTIFFLPWWIVFLVALALLFYFDRFYEVIIIGIIADVLYSSINFLDFPYPITLVSIIFLYIISKFKKNLIAY